MNETVKSTIRLFKSVVTSSKINNDLKEDYLKDIYSKTIKHGFVLAPEVISSYSKNINLLVQLVIEELGVTPEQLNSTLHKSWGKVANASMEQLVMEQYVHYFTTYGFKDLGIYTKESIYIPNETLELPKTQANIPLIVIKGISKSDLKKKVKNMLTSGIAFKTETTEALFKVCSMVDLKEDFVDEIKNKEIKMLFYKEYDAIPTDNVEFLRYLMYITTGKTLLIKDRSTISSIKENIVDEIRLGDATRFIQKYHRDVGIKKLAEIFYRFKPLFLAFKPKVTAEFAYQNYKVVKLSLENVSYMKKTINTIRKLAKKNHKPMKEDLLNQITSHLSKGQLIDLKEFEDRCKKVNTMRKIRLAYALNFYLNSNTNARLYKIRNGSSYVTEAKDNLINKEEFKKYCDVVTKHIVADISKNVKGKTILIPNYVEYALPASEKLFTGMIPTGTSIFFKKDMVCGVHWFDIENKEHNQTIDLDLSMIDDKGNKLGWDGAYKSGERSILFSGDITAAPKPKGATELFAIQSQDPMNALMYVNYYNFSENYPVDFDIVIAEDNLGEKNLSKNYMIDQNKIICKLKTTIDKRQMLLGFVKVDRDGMRFIFNQTQADAAITSRVNRMSDLTREYLVSYYSNPISMKELLIEAGANIVSKEPSLEDKYEIDIDLTPEKLEKDTFINLLHKGDN